MKTFWEMPKQKSGPIGHISRSVFRMCLQEDKKNLREGSASDWEERRRTQTVLHLLHKNQAFSVHFL
jgi:hypothetical protein